MHSRLPEQERTAHLRQGRYIGASRNHHLAFLGVPYALPPTGDRRFLPPKEIAEGDGTYDATTKGPACSQVAGRILCGKGRDSDRYSEDCLRLNIYTPGLEKPARPVMVWIHGGAFTLGSSNSYDGGGLCESGNILVVTLNYRLGVFGFADIGNVTNTVMPGNLGLRDIVQALKWIKDNIAAFGGDPDQVTVAGESAGSIALSLLLLADTASGLFRGVILQSGGINLIHDKAMAAQTSRAYRKVLGDPTLAELRAMPAGKLLQAQISVARLLGGAIPCSPWFDGDLLPASLKAAHSKPTHPVRMLAGYNREETALFEKLTLLLPVPVHRRFCEDQLRRALGETHASDIIASYPETRMGSRLLATDLYFSMGMINMLERHSERAPAWHYRFDYRHWWLGAAHGLELLFLWPFNGPLAALGRGGFLTGQKRALAETLQRHWIIFVRHGQPGQDWGEYKTGDRQTMLLDMHSRLERDPASETRKIWKGQDFIPRTFGRVSDEASL